MNSLKNIFPKSGFTLILLLTLSSMSACNNEQATEEAPLRSIKWIKVEDKVALQERRIAGRTEANIVSDLSFQVGGQVKQLEISVGDNIKQGEVIAKLDDEPFKLDLDAAKGNLDDAIAQAREAQQKYVQQLAVFKKNYISKYDFAAIEAARDSTRGLVEIARSKLAIAERDLRQTVISSPMDGTISEKYVEKFEEVSSGQPIVNISSEGDLKVEIGVPETMQRYIQIDDMVQIVFPTLENRQTEGRISEIGERVSTSSTFPVTIIIQNPDEDIRPGMSAEAILTFNLELAEKTFLLPVTALLPSGKLRQGNVFVFKPDPGGSDQNKGTVEKRSVQTVNVLNNELHVTGDIKVGDIVAAAGVSFLMDGMPVKLFKSTP